MLQTRVILVSIKEAKFFSIYGASVSIEKTCCQRLYRQVGIIHLNVLKLQHRRNQPCIQSWSLSETIAIL